MKRKKNEPPRAGKTPVGVWTVQARLDKKLRAIAYIEKSKALKQAMMNRVSAETDLRFELELGISADVEAHRRVIVRLEEVLEVLRSAP